VLFGIENVGHQLVNNPIFLRDAILLGTAAAMTAPDGPDAEPARRRLVRLEELAGIAGLMVIAAYFRPTVNATWQLPGTAWLFLTLGLGFVLGALVYALLSRTRGAVDFPVLTLGSIAFAGGAAAYLSLSPIVVAFVAGVMVANLPGSLKEQLQPTLRRFERPIYLLFLFVVGAIWNVADWRSWALALLFAAMRLAGKYLGARLTFRREDLESRRALALAPMGPIAIAIVVSGQLLYRGGSIALVCSAVVGGALLTEIILQAGRRLFVRVGAM
jgi:Kef-type K+ transport system membrane component KefB